jgi:hypothetical protein
MLQKIFEKSENKAVFITVLAFVVFHLACSSSSKSCSRFLIRYEGSARGSVVIRDDCHARFRRGTL